jgi:hypothetical protein
MPMKYRKLVMLMSVLVMATGVPVAGQAKEKSGAKQSSKPAVEAKANVTVHRQMGTIASLAVNEMTLDRTWMGKEEKTKFTLEPDTKKEGNVQQGDHVIVYYHLEKGQRIATDLKATMAKPKAEAKKS